MKHSLDFSRAPPPKKELSYEWPEGSIPKELRENVSWIDGTRNVKEPNHIGGNSFSNTVVSECIVPLVEGGVGNGTTGDNALVVTKHVCLAFKRNSHHAKCIPKIHDPKNETSTTLRVIDFLRDLYAKLLGTALDATYLTYRSYASNRPW